MASSSKAQAKKRLQNALEAIPELVKMHYASPEFNRWKRNTEIAIENTFASKGRHIADFKATITPPRIYSGHFTFEQEQHTYAENLKATQPILQSMIDEIEEYWPDETDPDVSVEIAVVPKLMNNNIFVVHGRDTGTKETLMRFLENLKLHPIILQELPDQGRAIIEKFEDFANGAGFAVVLFTPDDEGSLADETNGLEPRARQNVIFELGYFIGKLGRDRVCVLVKGKVGMLSDYEGVLYILFDDNYGWQLKLVRELQSAGFNVDANDAIRRL